MIMTRFQKCNMKVKITKKPKLIIILKRIRKKKTTQTSKIIKVKINKKV